MIQNELNEILNLCCEGFSVNIDDVLSKSRKTDFVYCRTAFVVIVKEKYDLCNDKIGIMINRCHSNVHYLYKNQPQNKYFNTVLFRIKEKLKHV